GLLARAGGLRGPEGLVARGAGGGSAVLPLVARLVLEIADHVALDVAEVSGDVGLPGDADEHRPLALAPDAHGAEERVERPLGALGVELRALGDDRVRR